MNAVINALVTTLLVASHALAHQMDQRAETLLAAAAQPAGLSEGEIRRVDKEAKKLTIRHGPIANLDMPPMTMVFQVKDAAVLDQLKPGDKVRFQAEKLGGAYIVTRIETAR